jgi:hypothetical protein
MTSALIRSISNEPTGDASPSIGVKTTRSLRGNWEIRQAYGICAMTDGLPESRLRRTAQPDGQPDIGRQASLRAKVQEDICMLRKLRRASSTNTHTVRFTAFKLNQLWSC